MKICPLHIVCPLQTLSEVEDSLRELEQKVTELRSKADVLRSDQTSNQELLKLQVVTFRASQDSACIILYV